MRRCNYNLRIRYNYTKCLLTWKHVGLRLNKINNELKCMGLSMYTSLHCTVLNTNVHCSALLNAHSFNDEMSFLRVMDLLRRGLLETLWKVRENGF